MCEFHTLTDEQKQTYHELLLKSANAVGGKNFFLHLLEAIRETKPHPLVAKNRLFTMELAEVKWNKSIYPESLKRLLTIRLLECEAGNLLPSKEDKGYKKTLNLLRTLKPIVFHVKPTSSEQGSGFFFQPLERVDEHTTRLNPLFDALFFSSVEQVKKGLNYKPKRDVKNASSVS